MSTSNPEEATGAPFPVDQGNSDDQKTQGWIPQGQQPAIQLIDGLYFNMIEIARAGEENGESCAGVDTNEGADRRRISDFSYKLSNDDDVVTKRGTKLGLIDVSQ